MNQQFEGALDVRCPICDAAPGQSCEDVLTEVMGLRLAAALDAPHLYRIQVAVEEWNASLAIEKGQ